MVIVMGNIAGFGIGSAFAGLTIKILKPEITMIRIKITAKLLLILFILTIGIDFDYKASRKSSLTKTC